MSLGAAFADWAGRWTSFQPLDAADREYVERLSGDTAIKTVLLEKGMPQPVPEESTWDKAMLLLAVAMLAKSTNRNVR